jgi:outer membrane protein OmpA-like peptidoglycan-associated protein
MSLKVALRALLVVVCLGPVSAFAETPRYVRVLYGPAPIQEWYRRPDPQVLVTVDTGTVLEALDREQDWYWVITPPDGYGTRRGGWIKTSLVEPAPAPVRPAAAIPAAEAQASAEAVSESPAYEASAEASHADTVTMRSAPAAPSQVYTFEDVHFERDRYTLRQESMAALQAAVTALKTDPALTVMIQGHTCSLGDPGYNLGLGMRRATAVKDYLVSQGIPATRLHTISLGEDHAKHDNSQEATRQLNRRVAVVAEAGQ